MVGGIFVVAAGSGKEDLARHQSEKTACHSEGSPEVKRSASFRAESRNLGGMTDGDEGEPRPTLARHPP